MYFMKCEQVGSLSLMIFDHDYYIYVHYEKPPIFNPILAGLDIGNNMSESLCKRKKKYWFFIYSCTLTVTANVGKMTYIWKRLMMKTGYPKWLICLQKIGEGGGEGDFLLQRSGPGWHRLKFL